MPKDETYLGDGVYASLDSGMIKLRTERDHGRNDIIYLEPSVYLALREYARAVGFEPKPAEGSP